MLADLLKNYDTPLFIYDFNIAREKIDIMRTTIPENVDLFYSVKVNPNKLLLKKIKRFVAGMEVASIGELEKALESGVMPDNIIFVGPGKSNAELERAIKCNIYCIIIESVREAEIISELGQNLNKKQRIAVRVNTVYGNKGAAIKMGGASKPFGIDEECTIEAVEKIKKLPNINLSGVYTYSGTQILEYQYIVNGFEHTFKIAKRIQDFLDYPIEFIGFGGGYGIPYYENDEELDMISLRQGLEEVFGRYAHYFSPMIRYVTESGRFLVADCGYYIVKVLYTKVSRGMKYVIVDGGTNFLAIASGMGKFLRRNLSVYVLNSSDDKKVENVTIVGPLCTPTDILSQNILIPKCKEGDYIVYPKTGAYGYSASPKDFLSHRQPLEIIIEDNNVEVTDNNIKLQ